LAFCGAFPPWGLKTGFNSQNIAAGLIDAFRDDGMLASVIRRLGRPRIVIAAPGARRMLFLGRGIIV
jgi:hypothetical protein